MGAKCCYTVDTMRETLRCLTPLFDVVRLVDPTDTAVVTLEEDGSLRREPYTCFHVWNRECRCFNCTSMQAAAGSCQRTKYEFIRENVFYVVSQPLTLFAGGEQLEVVMEIVSHVSNQLLLEPQEDGKNMLERLEEITSSFNGVEKSFAIQAGREVRIMVKPEVISEDQMVLLARDIAKKIEDELEYPGQIKVHLLRETKAIEYAK